MFLLGYSRLRFYLLILCFYSFSVFPCLAATSASVSADLNGNLTSDGANCFTYNDANQLAKVTNCTSGQLIAVYIYDASGKRAVKKDYVNGQLVDTIYTVDKTFESKVTASGAKTDTSYYYLNDSQLVGRKNPDGSKNFYHTDLLGSVNVISDATGAQVEYSTYYPYGEQKSGGLKSKYLYTGQEKDNESGLYYYQSRYYSPTLKRFIQPDTQISNPYDPQELNRYTYVKNNPIKYTDPTGHFVFLGGLLAPLAAAIVVYWPAISQELTVNLPYIVAVTSDAITKYQSNPSWGQGFSSGLDVFSILPAGMFAGGIKDVSMAKNLVKTDDAFKPFTSGNFRSNLIELTGRNPLDAQAHHIFPQQKSLADQFFKAGIDIHNPMYGSWWDSTPGLIGNHPSMAREYNTVWTNFFTQNVNPIKTEILDFARSLGEKYNFLIHY